MLSFAVVTGALAALLSSTQPATAGSGQLDPPVDPLRGAAAETFLRTAEVVDKEPLASGVTRSWRLTLRQGDRQARAAWKTIDEYSHVQRFERGMPELGFRDTWKHEVAAYELDKILGLGLVPPTVERRIGRDTGALTLWIEDAMTEAGRREKGLDPPDQAQWNREIYNVRLFRQLTYDTDFRNINNLLVGSDFHVWAIDHSRAFRTREELLPAMELDRFSREVLDRLRALTEKELDRSLGRWLTGLQIRSLLKRRDRIVAEADRLIAERGEAALF